MEQHKKFQGIIGNKSALNATGTDICIIGNESGKTVTGAKILS